MVVRCSPVNGRRMLIPSAPRRRRRRDRSPRTSSCTRGSGRRGGPAIVAAGREIEVALVARTADHALVDARHDRARQVRALLAVGDELSARRADAPGARIVRRRVAERLRRCPTAIVFSEPSRAICGLARGARRHQFCAASRLADDERQARQHQELHEVAARDVVVLRPVDREVASPARLLLHGRPSGAIVTVLGVARRTVDVRPAPCRSGPSRPGGVDAATSERRSRRIVGHGSRPPPRRTDRRRAATGQPRSPRCARALVHRRGHVDVAAAGGQRGAAPS